MRVHYVTRSFVSVNKDSIIFFDKNFLPCQIKTYLGALNSLYLDVFDKDKTFRFMRYIYKYMYK